jgi:hypothetical protein
MVVATTDEASAERVERARTGVPPFKLVFFGLLIWSIGLLLMAAVVDGYLDGRRFREAHASTIATVTSPGNGGRGTRQITFQAVGERQTAYVLLPDSVPVGAQVPIEYAVDDPFVANVAGERPQIHGRWGWVDIVVAAMVQLAAIAWHVHGVRTYRKRRALTRMVRR